MAQKSITFSECFIQILMQPTFSHKCIHSLFFLSLSFTHKAKNNLIILLFQQSSVHMFLLETDFVKQIFLHTIIYKLGGTLL